MSDAHTLAAQPQLDHHAMGEPPCPDDIVEAKRLLASDPSRAEKLARRVLRRTSTDFEALLVLGAALRRQGDADAARAILEPLVEFRAGSPELRLELGEALGALGENWTAVAVLSQAVNLDRTCAEAWRALGEQLVLVGDSKGSEAAFVHSFYLSVTDPELQKAALALQDDRPQDAEDIILEFLETNPDNVNAIKLMAEIAVRLERTEDAAALLAQCVELEPDFAAARFRYASTLFQLNNMGLAIAQLRILLAADPRNKSYRDLMAASLGANGAHEESLALYEELAKECPRVAATLVNYGDALKVLGRSKESIAAYRRAIELQPSFGGAWQGLSTVKSFRFDDADIARLEKQLALPDLPDADRVSMHFSLGNAYEALQLFEKAFENYRRGNAIHRATVSYDADLTTAHLSACRRLFTREFFRQRSGAGCDVRDPIFIVGLPRSGSTLLEQILSCHSRIEGTMELPNVTLLARQINDENVMNGLEYPEALAGIGRAGLKALGEEYLENARAHRRLGRPFFTDKMPNNFSHVGFIHLILPNAKIVDMRRHPLGCCFGNFKQHFSRGQLFTNSLTDLGLYYRNYVALMAHFDELLPGKIHRVIYERLVANPEQEIRRLLDYLGLPFEDACLRFHESGRAVRTASTEQVRMPIFKDATEHWRNYEPWLGPAKEVLGAVLDAYPDVPAFDA